MLDLAAGNHDGRASYVTLNDYQGSNCDYYWRDWKPSAVLESRVCRFCSPAAHKWKTLSMKSLRRLALDALYQLLLTEEVRDLVIAAFLLISACAGVGCIVEGFRFGCNANNSPPKAQMQ